MLESEVKFFVVESADIRDRLRRAGAQSTGRAFETNFRYDTATHQLLAQKCLLRLRRDRCNRLTFKKPHPSGGRQVKTHEEWEVEVSDFDTTHQILNALGFHRAQVYEKVRETFELEMVEICLDQLPFGHFVEIEGPPETLPAVAAHIGLAWPRRILATYLQIFEAIRNTLGLAFPDLTFAYFQRVDADLTAVIRQFEAEPPP